MTYETFKEIYEKTVYMGMTKEEGFLWKMAEVEGGKGKLIWAIDSGNVRRVQLMIKPVDAAADTGDPEMSLDIAGYPVKHYEGKKWEVAGEMYEETEEIEEIVVETMWELTNQESGIVINPDGTVFVCNWSSDVGIPSDILRYNEDSTERVYRPIPVVKPSLGRIEEYIKDITEQKIYNDNNDELVGACKIYQVRGFTVLAPEGWN